MRDNSLRSLKRYGIAVRVGNPQNRVTKQMLFTEGADDVFRRKFRPRVPADWAARDTFVRRAGIAWPVDPSTGGEKNKMQMLAARRFDDATQHAKEQRKIMLPLGPDVFLGSCGQGT